MGQHVTRKRTNPTRQVPRHVLLKYSAHNVWSPVQHHFFLIRRRHDVAREYLEPGYGLSVDRTRSDRRVESAKVTAAKGGGSHRCRRLSQSHLGLSHRPHHTSSPCSSIRACGLPAPSIFRDQLRQSVRAVIDMEPT